MSKIEPVKPEDVKTELDEKNVEQRIKDIKAEAQDTKPVEKEQEVVEIKCEVEGCDFVAKGKTQGKTEHYLKMHSEKHEKKEEEPKKQSWIGGHTLGKEGEDMSRTK